MKKIDIFSVSDELIAEAYVGQNARENDELFKGRSSGDLWFHLKSGPSAHVWLVYTVNEKIVDNASKKCAMSKCAALVKSHSKCNGSAVVNYLEKKHLRSTETPGTVIMTKTPNRIV